MPRLAYMRAAPALRRKKIKLAPGEMETITLPASLIESITGDTIRIGLEEDK